MRDIEVMLIEAALRGIKDPVEKCLSEGADLKAANALGETVHISQN